MALFIKLEAICITIHLPHGSIYYTVVLKAACMCGVLKCYGPVQGFFQGGAGGAFAPPWLWLAPPWEF